jgi:hypothetical protein
MKISLLPKRNWSALLRLSFLTLLLGVVIIGCLGLPSLGRTGEIALRAAWYALGGRFVQPW